MKKILLSMFALMLAGMMQAQFSLSINGEFALEKDTTITITDYDDFDGDIEMGFTGMIISSAKVYVDITRPAGAKDELCAGTCLEGDGKATQTMEFDLSMGVYAGKLVPVFAHYYPTQPGVATYTYTFRSGTQSACLTVNYAYKAKQLSFPRKHLIEHFTGEQCGYCPYGMECIETFLASTSKNYIWVGHHYGFGTDEYSIAANATIGQNLSITGAPSVVFDRTKRVVKGTESFGFHPGYLTEKGAVPLNDADTALVSVVINRSYDAASRQLKLTVHGQVLSADTELLLSVLIKESGMIGKQKDFYGSWEGWNEFRHVKTVRAMLSTAWGDKVNVVDGEYSETFTYTLPANMVAENCEIVAYLTPNSTSAKSVINAEQIAVVEGTDGGESLLAEGLKAVPVSATYPESGTPQTNINFTMCNLNTSSLSTKGYIVVTLQAPTGMVNIGGFMCFPYIQLYVFSRTATLQAGTYPIVSENYDYGTIAAGFRDDEQFQLGGSMLYYVFLQPSGLVPMSKWLLVDGEVVIGGNGSILINATTLNGSKFQGRYGDVTPIDNVENMAAKDGKLIRDGKVVILRENAEYDMLGNRLR